MKQLYSIVFYIFTFSIEQCLTFGENCPKSQWSSDATTLIDSTSLYSPRDLYIDQNHVLYVLDSGNYRVQRLVPNSTLEPTYLNATTGSVFNELSYLVAIQGDANGNLYILDRGNLRVVKWSTANMNGIIVLNANGTGYGANQLSTPAGMFIDMNTSFIWLADTQNSRIVRWESPTIGIIVCGSNGSNSDQFFRPFGLFIDQSDSNTLYVADTYNHRVQRWLSGAKNGTTVAGQTGLPGYSLDLLYYPTSVTGDANKNLYILSYSAGSIIKWQVGSSFGTLIVGTLSSGSLSNQLLSPYNFKFDSDGSILVADYGNSRVQKFSFVCSNATSTARMTTNPTSSSSTTIRTTKITTNATLSASMAVSTVTTTKRISSVSADCNLQWISMIFSSILILINS
ncbi:unnamed protein product [Adineta ricciae]|uniref:Cyclic nucleotide-binding domain-containing protein n=1 Tax=Adineta ricciae TaxID=249248 RepID=A0A814JC54_ADIRI|nr:unnamed protein product [Adineta ricciae]CAF1037340.1 unnamed protein product [Adineta ricciae]